MSKRAGFSLIELMIVVALIAVLSMIAYPSYQEYLQRGHRSAGQQFLLDVAQSQEQFLLDSREYAATLAGLGIVLPNTVSRNYTFDGFIRNAAGARPFFQCALVPVAGAPMANDGRLFINSRGQRWWETDPVCSTETCAYSAGEAF